MKYSLRSLMIVVTLAAVLSAMVARSRYCAGQAAALRKDLISEHEEQSIRVLIGNSHLDAFMTAVVNRQFARTRHHRETYLAYERASRMPWLPLLLPERLPETPLPPWGGCMDEELTDEQLEDFEKLFDPGGLELGPNLVVPETQVPESLAGGPASAVPNSSAPAPNPPKD